MVSIPDVVAYQGARVIFFNKFIIMFTNVGYNLLHRKFGRARFWLE